MSDGPSDSRREMDCGGWTVQNAPPVRSSDGLGGWQPIATASKNETVLLWWRTCSQPSVGRWTYDEEDDREGWRCDGDRCVPKNQHDCLYWHPLPEPPNDRAKAAPLKDNKNMNCIKCGKEIAGLKVWEGFDAGPQHTVCPSEAERSGAPQAGLPSATGSADARASDEDGADSSVVRQTEAVRTGVELIAAERLRQTSQEGWTPEHDDRHKKFQLTLAAVSYAQAVASPDDWAVSNGEKPRPTDWPWGKKWWKPSADPIRNLVKAGALIAAEIDRLQRAAARPTLARSGQRACLPNK